MFGVTTDGFVLKDLATIRSEIDDFQRANISAGLDLSDQSVLGQINAVMASQLAEMWELAQAVYASQYPDSANGMALDEVAAITGTTRDAASKATVTAQVTLAPNAPLPAGSVAHIVGQPNSRFVSLVTEPGSVPGGVFDVAFEAEEAGELTIAPNQLTVIAEAVLGWISVDNSAAGVSGTDVEDDPDLRVKRTAELEGQGSTNVNSIRAALLRLTGVLDASVFENDTDVVDPSTGAPAHSVYAVLRGGVEPDIAQSIFDTKAAGIATFGGETEAVFDSQGVSHDINFDFATDLTFFAIFEVLVDQQVVDGVDGIDAIKQEIEDYVNSLNVGQDVIYDQVRCACLMIDGVIKVNTLTIGFAPVPVGVIDLDVAFDEVAISDVANIDGTAV